MKVIVDKYRLELSEILDEIIEYNPSLNLHIGVSSLFNWRAIFDFSSEAWTHFKIDSRTMIVNALAEKRTLFIEDISRDSNNHNNYDHFHDSISENLY
jgi:methionine synthase II (cobalamin-independent)